MARVKIEVPAEAPKSEPLEREPWPKCACPGPKPSTEVLVASGGRCSSCGRGVYVSMPEASDADESIIPPSTVTALAGVVGRPPAATVAAVPQVPAGVTVLTSAPSFPPPGFEGSRVGDDRAFAYPPDDLGESVKILLGEQMFGLKGTFSSYHVPAVGGETKVREGETRRVAFRRLHAELLEEQHEGWLAAKAAFETAFPKAFGSGS